MRSARRASPETRARFLIDPFAPSYLELERRGELGARVTAALEELRDCCACPRECHVDRTSGRKACAVRIPLDCAVEIVEL